MLKNGASGSLALQVTSKLIKNVYCMYHKINAQPSKFEEIFEELYLVNTYHIDCFIFSSITAMLRNGPRTEL